MQGRCYSCVRRSVISKAIAALIAGSSVDTAHTILVNGFAGIISTTNPELLWTGYWASLNLDKKYASPPPVFIMPPRPPIPGDIRDHDSYIPTSKPRSAQSQLWLVQTSFSFIIKQMTNTVCTQKKTVVHDNPSFAFITSTNKACICVP